MPPFPLILTLLASLISGDAMERVADVTQHAENVLRLAPRDGALSSQAAETSWLSGSLEEIGATEYEFSCAQDGTWSAPNRALDLRARIGGDGLRLTPRRALQDSEVAHDWHVALRLKALVRGGVMEEVDPAAEPVGGGNAARLDLRRPGLLERYRNGRQGLEQGFLISEISRPEDLAAPLLLEMSLDSSLRVREMGEGRGLVFMTAGGGPALYYQGVSAIDARGLSIPIRTFLLEDRVRILVRDDEASYPVEVTMLVTSPSWSVESDQATSLYGWSVAPAGDVNGDGFDDVIVGAPLYDRGQADEGRVFVYLGSPGGLSSKAAWTAAGDQPSAQLGFAVASAGDVNGDGFGDIIAGANLYDNGQINEGRAFIWLGGPSGLGMSSKPGNAFWSVEGEQAGAQLGYSVASAGDVNRDGFGDVIVGAWRYDNGEVDEGQALVYLGSPSGPAATPAWQAEGNQDSAYFAFSVRTAGDVNGDGFGDIIIGAPFHDNDQIDEGRAFVYLGSAAGVEPAPSWTAEGDQDLGQLGYSVAGAGDVNGDRFGDVILGARGYHNGEQSEGRALVYLGSPAGLLPVAGWSAESDNWYALFGYSVSPAGDVNADGFSDVLIGADGFSGTQINEGKAYLFLGSALGLSALPSWSFQGNQLRAFLGRSVAGAGDVDGDGFSDLLVGSDGHGSGQPNEGRALLFTGSP